MYKYLMGRNEEEGVRFSVVPTDKTGSTEHKVKNKTGNTTHTHKKRKIEWKKTLLYYEGGQT